MDKFQSHSGFRRMLAPNKLTLGLHIPMENFGFHPPVLNRQIELSQRAEQFGFTGLWLRDVLLQDPAFGDPATGQIYDMMIYMTYLASHTSQIAFGTSAVVLTLRHPLRVAKEIATLDRLFPERVIMGISSGDRPADFAALGVSQANRGEKFREAFTYLQQVLNEDYPSINNSWGTIQRANLVPKPTQDIPTFITGYSQQSMEWFAQNGDGWIYYPRSPADQASSIHHWRTMSQQYHPGRFKPFIQPMHLDLTDDPNTPPPLFGLVTG